MSLRRPRFIPSGGLSNARLVVLSISLTSADTDYSFKFPNGTIAFSLHRRDGGTLRLYGKAGGSYYTFSGHAYFEGNFNTSREEVIVQSPDASKTLEVMMWVRG